MADIELVIKISEEVYKKAKETHDAMCDSVWLGIKYGTPLPKGHGDLIERDEVTAYDNLYEVHTIIEADKGKEE